MEIKNPLKMNDWDIKSFLIIVFSISLAYFGAVGLDKLGIQIPFLRPLLGFIYLTFIPGYLLLRILKIHNLSPEESFLYALGLSLFFNMFVGFLMNTFYPMLGITDKPISEIPIVVTCILVTLSLSILAYFRDRRYCSLEFINLKNILSPQFLFLSLIPFIAIYGTYLVNHYYNNVLLIIMIVIVALIILITLLTNVLAEEFYSYTVWIIAVSLILHTTLITNYIQVQDVIGEYYIANRVIMKGFWEYTIPDTYNSVLSTAILPPILYHITGISLTWIYKVIFPFLLSLIPPFVYKFYRKYLSSKVSLASSYLIVVLHPYFITLPFLSKQLVAEIFMMLFIHTLLMNIKSRNILNFIFIFGIVFSHYGTSYLIFGMLIFMTIYNLLTQNIERNSNNTLSWNTILMEYTTVLFGWYIYIAKSVTFSRIVHILNAIVIHVKSGLLFNPLYSRGMGLLVRKLPLLGVIDKYLYLLISLLMLIGVVIELIHFIMPSKKKIFDSNYLGFSIYWMIILGATVAIPGFAVMNPYRLYHLSSLILSPFVITGIKRLIEHVSSNWSTIHLEAVAALLVIFLLLNTGVASEILKLPPFYSSSINQETAIRFGSIDDVRMVYGRLITTYDVVAAKWIGSNMNSHKDIYSHSWGYGSSSLHSYGKIPLSKIKTMTINLNDIPPGNYVFVAYILGKFKLWYRLNPLGQPVYYHAGGLYTNLALSYNIIYTTGYCKVLIS